jgi:hypothetical protein
MRFQRLIACMCLGGLLAVLGLYLAGVCYDDVMTIRYPFELDYGEGIVWQQALLIPGPRMYGTSTEVPFIVFHYPPLYYLLVHAARVILPDYLAAGRLVATTSAIPIGLSVMGLVLTATRPLGRTRVYGELAIAAATGALVLCLHVFRTWGQLMRVDMPGVALALLGLLLASRSAGRFWGITGALLLCGAAVFTKQTEFPAGLAVFLVVVVRKPSLALGAAGVAGSVCLGGLALLEGQTSGGFLQNIVGDNVAPMALRNALLPLWQERSSLPTFLLMVLAAWFVGRSVLASVPSIFSRAGLQRLRAAEAPTLCRILLLAYFVMALLTTPAITKEGSNFNYLLDLLAAGCTLLGVTLVDLWRRTDGGVWAFSATAAVLIATIGLQPVRQLQWTERPDRRAPQAALVRRIAAADKPVASEDLVLLMRAGKPVIFEPAIVTELTETGQWDEAPLVRMIRSGAFAFVVTRDNDLGGNRFRTPVVDAAMRAVYPRVDKVTPTLWLHLPTR